MAVVCPGRGTARPATGRGWRQTFAVQASRLGNPGARSGRLRGRLAVALQRSPRPDLGQRTNEGGTGRSAQVRALRMPLRDSFDLPQCDAAGAHGWARRACAVQASIATACAVFGSPPVGSGADDKRHRHHHPASQPGAVLPVLILKIPNNPILQSSAPTRLQLRCNPGAHRNVRTRSGIPSSLLRPARPVRLLYRCRSRRLVGIPFVSIDFAFWRGR